MPLIEWSPVFNVNVKKSDDQHKKLVELINQLHDSMKAGQANASLGNILQSLITYTATHFKEEEQMLQLNGYPDLVKHKAIHAEFVKKVIEIQKKFQESASGAVLSMGILSFLKEWLMGHIKVEDKKYGVFLNDKGIK